MKGKGAYILIAVLITLFVVFLSSMPKELDWSDSFSKFSKQPFGAQLIEKNMHPFFTEVEKVEVTAYQKLELNTYGYEYNNNTYDSESYTESPVKDEAQEIPETEEQDATSEKYLSTSDSVEYPADEVSTENPENIGTSEYNEGTSEGSTIAEEDEFVNNPAISDKKIKRVFSNYIFVNRSLDFDETDINALFSYVRSGNSVFIAATWYRGILQDTFNLDTKNTYLGDTIKVSDFISRDKIPVVVELKNRTFHPSRFTMKGFEFGNSFSSIDSSEHCQILGVNSKNEANFIRVKVGEGYFYLSSVPHAYTNFAFSRNEMATYAASSISYLPRQKTYWDEYYKVGRVHNRDSLDFIKNNIPLNWAWTVAIIGFLLYMFFESKRYQRMIPIVQKLRNSTVEFVYTMGRLYAQRGDHHDLASKKILYFLELVRHNYYLATHEFTEDFKSRLSHKSGVERKEIEHLFNLISHMQRSKYCTRQDLMELNQTIDNFKKKSKLR